MVELDEAANSEPSAFLTPYAKREPGAKGTLAFIELFFTLVLRVLTTEPE